MNSFTPLLCNQIHSINEPSIEVNNFDEFVEILCFCPIFFEFLINFFGNSWLQYSNVENDGFRLEISVYQFLILTFYDFELHQIWPKIFKIEQFSITLSLSLSFLYTRDYFRYMNRLYTFFRNFDNSTKNFQNLGFFVLKIMFVGNNGCPLPILSKRKNLILLPHAISKKLVGCLPSKWLIFTQICKKKGTSSIFCLTVSWDFVGLSNSCRSLLATASAGQHNYRFGPVLT